MMRAGHPLWRKSIVIALILGLGLGASASLARKKKMPEYFPVNPDGYQLSRAELRVHVRALALPFSGLIEDTADTILAESSDPDVRELALRWKINGIPAIQAAIFQPKPLVALLDVWALVFQTRESFESGPDSQAPAEVVAIAQEAISEMESRINRVARLLGSTEAVEVLRRDIESWAARNPISASRSARSPTTSELARLTAGKNIGVRATVLAMNETASDMAARLDVYTAYLPKQARWQAEYLLHEMALDEDLTKIALGTAALSSELASLADTVDGAPELVADERRVILEALRKERIAVLESLHAQLVEALEFLETQRIEVFSNHLQTERQAVLAALAEERRVVLEALQDERVAALDQIEAMTQDLVLVTLEDLVDHAFIRLSQFSTVVLLVLGLTYLVMRRRTTQ